MQTAPPVLSLFLIILSYSGWTNGLCNLENGTVARCNELKDVKYIETYDLDTLKAPVLESVLRPGYFTNLTSLRHLDLSVGDLKHIDPGSFHGLTNLRSLNLAENRIASLESSAVRDLNHLHSLNLRKNNLHQLPPVVADLKSLRHLDVQGNPLQCNCATLLIRDLIMKRGVKISKKVICAGPSNMKGTPMFKPDTTIVCNLEEQDREMQKDQAYNEPEEEYGSGDDIDKKVDDDEFVDIPDTTSEPPKPVEIETPAPTTVCSPDDCLVDNVSENDGDIILSEDEVPKKLEVKKVYKDALFSPDEGSGDEEEGSGEGSGNITIFDGWGKAGDVDETTHSEEESQSLGDKLFDTLFNVFLSTTKAPETKKDLNLEEEQFIDASVTKEADETTAVPKKANVDESVPVTGSTIKVDTNVTTIPSSDGVELLDGEPHDHSKMGKVKADEEDLNDTLAEVSPAKQSKKGMGSYVVLAALLAILATLIVFAAYKGDFCRKKRKRGDVENGTDMKDMQKALLDTGNATQPKVVTNGTMENVPLVEDSIDHEETKRTDVHQTEMEVSRPSNGTLERVDPVKPPRRTNEPSSPDRDSLKYDSSPARTSPVDVTVNNGPSTDVNGPPLSPGAQRVKITLQENPDSVPRTPILITRTMAGENLVKTP